MPLGEKPFRSDAEPVDIEIWMGLPRVRPHLVPAAGKTGPLTKDDFVTRQPSPTPPAHWIELLREAPFGTQAVGARDLHWDGQSFSIELYNESNIEAFGVEMPEWIAFANAEYGRREHTPAEEALVEARRPSRTGSGAETAAPARSPARRF